MGQLTLDFEQEQKNKAGTPYKQYNISDLNKSYLDAFQQAKYPDIHNNSKQRLSWNQYRSTVSRFLESLSKDVAMVKREDVDLFLESATNAKNKAAHIKAFLNFIIVENVKNCRSKIGRDLLIKLLEM